MDDRETLLALEEAFWHAAGDRDAYEQNLAGDAVHVFPGWGVTDREATLASVAGADPWETVSIEDPRFVALGADVAAIVYEAHATRSGGRAYTAAMTSVYRREDSGWKLVVHQQTPLEPHAE